LHAQHSNQRWADFGSDATLEPAFEPFALFALWAKAQAAEAARGVSSRDAATSHDEDTDGVEDVLEQHVDRFWSPPYHPQELQARAMTEDFLLEGLCASKALFARKFAPSFTLRDAPLPRGADGMWQCPAAEGGDDVWKAAPRARIDGLSCDGMRHAPVAHLGAHECRALCCAMGREHCTAWQYRGRWTDFHYCWVGHVGTCSEYPEAQSQLWRGERLLEGPLPPALNATAEARRRVVDAFARCFRKARDEAAALDGTAAEAAPEATADATGDAPLEQAQAAEDVLPHADEADNDVPTDAAVGVAGEGGAAADDALPAPGGERAAASGVPVEAQPAVPELEPAAAAAVENSVTPPEELAGAEEEEAEPDAEELAAARADAAGVDMPPTVTLP
jgi:hypothetical protein